MHSILVAHFKETIISLNQFQTLVLNGNKIGLAQFVLDKFVQGVVGLLDLSQPLLLIGQLDVGVVLVQLRLKTKKYLFFSQPS